MSVMRTWWNGRHNRLKICWALCPCGFESRLPHHQKPRFRGFFLFFYVVRQPFPFAFKNVSGHQRGTAISVSFLPTNEIIILKSNTFFKPQSLSIINSFRRTFFILILTDCFGLSRTVGLDDTAGCAVYTGVKINTLAVWRMTNRYGLPFVKLGKVIRCRKSDLDEWIDENVSTKRAK